MDNRDFGLVVDYYGLKEHRHLYSGEELKKYDGENFKAYPDGDYEAYKDLGAGFLIPKVRYIVTPPLKNDEEIKDFLLNYNGNETICDPKASGTTVYAGWLVEQKCFFTGEINETTVNHLIRLGIAPSDMWGFDSRDDFFSFPDDKPLTEDQIVEQRSMLAGIYGVLEDIIEETGSTKMQVFTRHNGMYTVRPKDLLSALYPCERFSDHITLVTGRDMANRKYVIDIPFSDITMILDGDGIIAYETNDDYEERVKSEMREKEKNNRFVVVV